MTIVTERMLPLRIFWTQLPKKRARPRTECELDARGDATSGTGKVLSMPRHWLATGEAPGILLSLLLAAFGF
ncbi:MAG TPA: hypothetical protein VFI24_24695 [Pyrinomonadaceae bacterium]|nr:hypothetical protein [Pyrinomonadaceae bacterium]